MYYLWHSSHCLFLTYHVKHNIYAAVIIFIYQTYTRTPQCAQYRLTDNLKKSNLIFVATDDTHHPGDYARTLSEVLKDIVCRIQFKSKTPFP